MQKLYSLFVFCLGLLLAACGFHLRGQVNLPVKLNDIYISSPTAYSPIVRSIRSALQANHIHLVESAKDAQYILHVSDPDISHNAVTTGSPSSSREYQVDYKITVSLEKAQGVSLLAPFTLAANRKTTVLPDKLLENTGQLVSLKQDMQNELAQKLLFKLNSNQTRLALEGKNETSTRTAE